MELSEHFRRLERMYKESPVNAFYGASMAVDDGRATVTLEIDPKFHHAAGAVHGSVLFKLLDDSSFFAANSVEPELFVLTSAYTTYLLRPVAAGNLVAVGTVVQGGRRQILCESEIVNDAGKVVARGSGTFLRSEGKLMALDGYGRPLEERS